MRLLSRTTVGLAVEMSPIDDCSQNIYFPPIHFSPQLKISMILFDRRVYPSSGWNSLAIIKRLLDQECKKKRIM